MNLNTIIADLKRMRQEKKPKPVFKDGELVFDHYNLGVQNGIFYCIQYLEKLINEVSSGGVSANLN